MEVIDSRGRTLSPCRRQVAEREVRLQRAKWIGKNRIRLRFDPFAYRYIRLKVLARDNYTCYWCGRPGFTIDHIVPWSKGGRTTMSNCVTACQECNGQRGDTPAEEFARIKGVQVPSFTGNEPVPKARRARQAAGQAAMPAAGQGTRQMAAAAPEAAAAPQVAAASQAAAASQGAAASQAAAPAPPRRADRLLLLARLLEGGLSRRQFL